MRTLFIVMSIMFPLLALGETDVADQSVVQMERKLAALDQEVEEKKWDLRLWEHAFAALSRAREKVNQLTFDDSLKPSIERLEAYRNSRSKMGPGDAANVMRVIQLLQQNWMSSFYMATAELNPGGFAAGQPENAIVNTVFSDIHSLSQMEAADQDFILLREDDFLSNDKKQIDLSLVDKALGRYKEDGFNKIKQKHIAYFSEKETLIKASIDDLNLGIKSLTESADILVNEIAQRKERQGKIDQQLISVGLPAFAAAMIILMLIPRCYKDGDLQREIFASGVIVQAFTVFLLTATILLLGFGNKIESSTLGTLLGGISGFVLGRSSGKVKNVTEQKFGN